MRDIEWLRRLIRLVEESDIDSLEVERFTTRVRISKSPGVTGGVVATTGVAPGSPAPAVEGAGSSETRAPGGAAGASQEEPAPGTAAAGLSEIKSPMVGTFYRAPSPESDPFVRVGDRVEEGETLCILEAMKLMNELEAEVAGVVREILVENGDPVEFGQLLFRIEAD